jgi:hypothetical protein
MIGSVSRRWSILLTSATLVVAGCGSSGGQNQMVRTGQSQAAVGADGQLKRNPDPLRWSDVQRARKGSAPAAVTELLFWAQWGSFPNVVAAYDHDIVKTVGSSNIAGAFAAGRASLVATRPRINDVRPTRSGTVVTVDLFSVAAAPSHESFVLRRRSGAWAVAFDTMLERNLAGYVQGRKQSLDDPAGTLSPRAVRAGAEAARQYRDIAATEVARRRATAERATARMRIARARRQQRRTGQPADSKAAAKPTGKPAPPARSAPNAPSGPRG